MVPPGGTYQVKESTLQKNAESGSVCSFMPVMSGMWRESIRVLFFALRWGAVVACMDCDSDEWLLSYVFRQSLAVVIGAEEHGVGSSPRLCSSTRKHLPFSDDYCVLNCDGASLCPSVDLLTCSDMRTDGSGAWRGAVRQD